MSSSLWSVDFSSAVIIRLFVPLAIPYLSNPFPQELLEPYLEHMQEQLGQPRAQRRELNALEARLRGKEMAKKEVVKIVDEWLQAGDDDVVEVV